MPMVFGCPPWHYCDNDYWFGNWKYADASDCHNYKTTLIYIFPMKTPSNGNIFCVTGPLCQEQWRGALMFSLICAWINDWVNIREAGNLRRHRAHYYVIVVPESYNRKDTQHKLAFTNVFKILIIDVLFNLSLTRPLPLHCPWWNKPHNPNLTVDSVHISVYRPW